MAVRVDVSCHVLSCVVLTSGDPLSVDHHVVCCRVLLYVVLTSGDPLSVDHHVACCRVLSCVVVCCAHQW